MLDNVTVVIRSTGERTEQACYNSVLQQVRKENIFIVNKKPFSEAVRANFKIGIEQNKPWTLALDADLILAKGAISQMIVKLEELGDNYYIYQGWVYDKFFKGFRTGGPHLYRTSLLQKGITFIPKEGKSLRPESDTYRAMQEIGYHYYVDNRYYGLHDFEQYKRDIYRKFFLHSKKHRSYVKQFMESWKHDILLDADYSIALKGLSDGLLYDGEVLIDTDFFAEKSNHIFTELGVVEKGELIKEDVFKDYFLEVENKLPKKDNWLDKEVDDSKNAKDIKNASILKKIKRKLT